MSEPYVSNRTLLAVLLFCTSLLEQKRVLFSDWCDGDSHDLGFARYRHQEPELKRDRFTRGWEGWNCQHFITLRSAAFVPVSPGIGVHTDLHISVHFKENRTRMSLPT